MSSNPYSLFSHVICFVYVALLCFLQIIKEADGWGDRPGYFRTSPYCIPVDISV